MPEDKQDLEDLEDPTHEITANDHPPPLEDPTHEETRGGDLPFERKDD